MPHTSTAAARETFKTNFTKTNGICKTVEKDEIVANSCTRYTD